MKKSTTVERTFIELLSNGILVRLDVCDNLPGAPFAATAAESFFSFL
jgi:hypothetical protein